MKILILIFSAVLAVIPAEVAGFVWTAGSGF